MPLSAPAAAREILTRLHDVMGSRSATPAKLSAVVQIIGEALNSEVCSIYLLRDGLLELFATRGLSQAAVHVTKPAPGEGLEIGRASRREGVCNDGWISVVAVYLKTKKIHNNNT